MTGNSETKAPSKTAFSTRQGNGSALLPGVDGRSTMARRYRELVGTMTDDLGGDLPAAKQAIVNRAATLIAWAEQAEAEFARTGEMDVATFTTAVNSLRRLLSDIGLDRQAKDVTPTLSEYLASKAREKREAGE